VLPETPPIVGGEIQTDVFLPPVHELTKFGATSRTKVFVRRFDYELVTLTEVAPTSKTRANVKILIITRVVDTVDVTVNSYAPSIPVQVPATNVDTTIGVIQASPLLSPAPVSLVNVQIYPPGVTSA
jgi:hypothetical protein